MPLVVRRREFSSFLMGELKNGIVDENKWQILYDDFYKRYNLTIFSKGDRCMIE